MKTFFFFNNVLIIKKNFFRKRTIPYKSSCADAEQCFSITPSYTPISKKNITFSLLRAPWYQSRNNKLTLCNLIKKNNNCKNLLFLNSLIPSKNLSPTLARSVSRVQRNPSSWRLGTTCLRTFQLIYSMTPTITKRFSQILTEWS